MIVMFVFDDGREIEMEFNTTIDFDRYYQEKKDRIKSVHEWSFNLGEWLELKM